jgi:integrase
MPMPTPPKRAYLTDDLIRNLTPPTDRREQITWDAPDPAIPGSAAFVVVGFGLRQMATGHVSLHFDGRLKDGSGRKFRVRLGRWPLTKADAARKKAKDLQQLVENGGDPTKKRREAKASSVTVNELADMFEKEHMTVKNVRGIGNIRASTAANYRSLLRFHIRPNLGHKRIGAVTKEDVKRIHLEISTSGGCRKDGALYQANRVLTLISTMFNFAIEKKLIAKGANPADDIKANKERARKRYLSDEELVAVKAAIDAHQDGQCVAAIRFLMWTGARKTEALAAKWETIDLHRKVRGGDGNIREFAVWDRLAPDMKGDEDSSVPLADAARRLLLRLHIEQGEPSKGYVFPSTKSATGHLVEVGKFWSEIKQAAGVTKSLRLHDLRHSFASFLVSDGVPLEVIGSLLGHRSPRTTARYAHLKDGPQRRAVETVAKIIAGEGAEVIPGPWRNIV